VVAVAVLVIAEAHTPAVLVEQAEAALDPVMALPQQDQRLPVVEAEAVHIQLRKEDLLRVQADLVL